MPDDINKLQQNTEKKDTYKLLNIFIVIIIVVLIIGFSILVQVSTIGPSARDRNRDAVMNDLVNLSAKAQQYYRRPIKMGGGGNDFKGFRLSASDSSNANGQYAIDDDSLGAVSRTVGSSDSIAVSTQEIWIVGIGVEIGNDGKNPIKAIINVSPNTFGQSHVLN